MKSPKLSKLIYLVFLFILLNNTNLNSQCPVITSTTYSTNCFPNSVPCTICPYEKIIMSAFGTNLPEGGCVNWFLSQEHGFDPLNGVGKLIALSIINANFVNYAQYLVPDSLCNEGTFYIVGVIHPGPPGCPETYTSEFAFNVVCPNATIDANDPVCDGYDLTLFSSGGVHYSWSGPSGFTSKLQNPVIQSAHSNNSGNYSVTVTDEYGCKKVKSKFIQVVPPILVFIEPQVPEVIKMCEGQDTTLKATVVGGGTGNYAIDGWFKWNSIKEPQGEFISTNYKLSVSQQGGYGFWVHDLITGCKYGKIKFIEIMPPLIVDIHSSSLNICEGGADTLNVLSSNAVYPLNYIWSNGSKTKSINISSPGNYEVTITDFNGCPGKGAISINNGVLPIIDLAINSNMICPNDSSNIKANVTNGKPPYKYNWYTPIGSEIGSNVNAKTVGDYFVTVTDNLGCKNIDSININQYPDISISISPNEPFLCLNGSTQISAIASGGSGINFEYEWTTPLGKLYGSNIIASIPGEYSVLVTDQKGCKKEAFTNIKYAKNLEVKINPEIAEFCPGGSTNLEVNVTGGNGNYTYLWETPDGKNSTSTIKADLFGIYKIFVEDSNGCSGSAETNVMQKPNIIVTILPNPAKFCIGNGIFLSVLSNSNDKLSYKWSTPDGILTSDSIIANKSGTYYVTVTNNNYCTGSTFTNLTELKHPIIKILPNNVNFCKNGLVELNTLIDDGVTPFFYSWNTPIGTGTNSTFIAKKEGIYTVTVTDANGCSSTADKEVIESNNLNLNLYVSSSGICPDKSIDIFANINGGQYPFAYNWETPNGKFNTDTLSTSTPGLYKITVTDFNSCTKQDEIYIENFMNPKITIPDSIGFCKGTEVQIKASTDDNPLTNIFNWNSPMGNLSNNIINVNKTGLYSLTVTNSGGCTSTKDITVYEFPTPKIKYSPNPLQFCKGSSLNLNLNSCEGKSPISFELKGPTSFYNSIPINLVEFGNYTLKIVDGNTCFSDTILKVIELPGLNLNLKTDPELLCNIDKYSINSIVNGGQLPYKYSWKTPFGIENNSNIESTDFGNFYLTVTDSKGCIGDATILTENKSQMVNIDITDVNCLASNSGGILLNSAINPSFPITFEINKKNKYYINSFPYLINKLTKGIYNLQIIGYNGCSESKNIEISSPQLLEFSLGDDISIFLGESYTIIPTANFKIDHIEWTNSNSLTCEKECIEAVASPLINTNYKAIAYNSEGCKTIDDINIFVNEKSSVYLPNSFSPNADGYNDKWVILTDQSVKQIKSLYIYDRWGESIFKQINFPPNDNLFGWDGNFRNHPLNSEVFVYYVLVEFNDGRLKEFKGDINLLR